MSKLQGPLAPLCVPLSDDSKKPYLCLLLYVSHVYYWNELAQIMTRNLIYAFFCLRFHIYVFNNEASTLVRSKYCSVPVKALGDGCAPELRPARGTLPRANIKSTTSDMPTTRDMPATRISLI